MTRLFVTLVALATFALVGCSVEATADPGPLYSGTYQGCIDDSDCDPADTTQCLRIDLGGGRAANHCSYGCTTDADCESFNPYASACYELFGDPARNTTCFERCNIDDDCSNGAFCCTTATMGGVPTDNICVPC